MELASLLLKASDILSQDSDHEELAKQLAAASRVQSAHSERAEIDSAIHATAIHILDDVVAQEAYRLSQLYPHVMNNAEEWITFCLLLKIQQKVGAVLWNHMNSRSD